METSLSVSSAVAAFFYTMVLKDKDQTQGNIHPSSRSACEVRANLCDVVSS